MLCTLLLAVSPEMDLYGTELLEENLIQLDKVLGDLKSPLERQRKIELSNMGFPDFFRQGMIHLRIPDDDHLLEPREAIPMEIDSMLFGFMGLASPTTATVLASIATASAASTCIMAHFCIAQSTRGMKTATTRYEILEKKSKIIHDILSQTDEEYSSGNLSMEDLRAHLKHDKKTLRKLRHFLKSERESILVNTFTAIGSISETLGFLGSRHLLGEKDLYPTLINPAHYLLALGLAIVSATSVWEMRRELQRLLHFYSFQIKDIKKEISLSYKNAQEIYKKHERIFAHEFREIVGEVGFNLSVSLAFITYLSNSYLQSLRDRVPAHIKDSVLKVISRFFVGFGTGIFSLNEISNFLNIHFLSNTSLTIIGTLTALGILVGLYQFFFHENQIKSYPAADSEGLDFSHIEILRMEIFAIILKLAFPHPKNKTRFEDSLGYFLKISPVDNPNFLEAKAEDAPFFGFIDPSQNLQQTTRQVFKRLKYKGLLSKAGNSVIRDLFASPTKQELDEWSPYINWDELSGSGFIDWDRIIRDGLSEVPAGKALQLLESFIVRAITRERQALGDELKTTIDELVRLKGKLRRTLAVNS